jgi:hypothetical protein
MSSIEKMMKSIKDSSGLKMETNTMLANIIRSAVLSDGKDSKEEWSFVNALLQAFTSQQGLKIGDENVVFNTQDVGIVNTGEGSTPELRNQAVSIFHSKSNAFQLGFMQHVVTLTESDGVNKNEINFIKALGKQIDWKTYPIITLLLNILSIVWLVLIPFLLISVFL